MSSLHAAEHPRRLPRGPRPQCAASLGLGVEGRLQVLEDERVVEDLDVGLRRGPAGLGEDERGERRASTRQRPSRKSLRVSSGSRPSPRGGRRRDRGRRARGAFLAPHKPCSVDLAEHLAPRARHVHGLARGTPVLDRADPSRVTGIDRDDACRLRERGLREVPRLPVVCRDRELLELGRSLRGAGGFVTASPNANRGVARALPPSACFRRPTCARSCSAPTWANSRSRRKLAAAHRRSEAAWSSSTGARSSDLDVARLCIPRNRGSERRP